ncbi:DUF3795 domain-containing protein [Patescibacteria group bacterium]|nr:DUF3795 domain-containing protein [Patescibacteria group bacterium]MBU1931314.1 DUF3795 domain-containing protein [Patescibacteria group bacterium]
MAGKDKNLVTYCGLCCLDCFGYKGKVADLARDLRQELRKSKFKNFADFAATTGFGKVYKNYNKCYEVLGAMVKFRCKKRCRAGGGNPFCKIRKCCHKKDVDGCWKCEDFEKCEKLNFLTPVHKNASRQNLKIIKKKGLDEFLKGKRYW